MTIADAIARLEQIRAKHGDVEVFFDCPACGRSFTPSTAVTVVARMTATPHEEPSR